MVGWAKSGTTDMWAYWQMHPDLLHGWKETQFLTQFSFLEVKFEAGTGRTVTVCTVQTRLSIMSCSASIRVGGLYA